MANDYFSFKQFTVRQEQCAMKVGTDGTLLGAWARVPSCPSTAPLRILDIGTGTGLIALMMAQRCPDASVTGIDTDGGAAMQAAANAIASPFSERVTIEHRALQDMPCGEYDVIVCNPPYFTDSLLCPDMRRSVARHSCELTYDELMTHSARLLAADGELSVVIPCDSRHMMASAAAIAGLCARRVCTVKTTARKPPKRVLLAYGKRMTDDVETAEIVIGSSEYADMMRDFYLK